jgi:hypothetical protein
MAITATGFGSFIAGQFGSTSARRTDWPGDTWKVTLHTSSMTPNQDAWDFADDLTNELSTGSGYAAGGVTVTGKTVTYDSATNEIRLDCDDPAWVSLVATFRYLVWRKDTGVDATSPLGWWVDLGADEVLGVATNWSLVIPATGAYKFTLP